jgi:peptidoglycan/xylan/chitin deacetylase (PgdA/CDA1 family)
MGLLKNFYDRLNPSTQSYIDRFRYCLNWLPRINRQKSFTYSQGAKATVVISTDLELAWAWRYVRDSSNPKALALQKAYQTRQNLPGLLELFDRFNVPVTWATVGHLFLEECNKTNGRAHPDLERPPYFENEFWRYADGDWFDSDPCSNYHEEPAWYAPDLIRSILSAKVKHEIACHTFSHIDCSDDYCPTGVMDTELAECQRLAAEWGLTLRSFVFPGNLYGNFSSLKRCGFSAYRFYNGYELDVPRQDELGLWQIPGGVCSEKPEGWSADAWIKAMGKCVDKALETGTVLHFWFHPSCEPINVERIFPTILEYIQSYRSDLWLTTIGGLVNSLV